MTRKGKNNPEGKQFSISLPSSDFALITENQKRLGLTRSEYARMAAIHPEKVAVMLEEVQLKDVPPAIRWANSDYKGALFRNTKNLERLSTQQEYRAICYPFLDIRDSSGLIIEEGTARFQAALQETAAELFTLGKQKAIHVCPKQESQFDALRRAGILSESRVLYMFPFFLSELRRPFWGVIPYGAHRRIGIFFANPNSTWLQKWKDISEADKSGAYSKTQNKVYRWFNTFIDDLFKRHREAVAKNHPQPILDVTEGFILQEIMQLLLANYGPPDSTIDFGRFVRSVYPLNPPDYLTKEAQDLDKACVFDLSERASFQSNEDQIISLPHGLTIPVGIGFSLGMWPSLQQADNWKVLYDRAKQLVLQPNYAPSFRAAGIELTER